MAVSSDSTASLRPAAPDVWRAGALALALAAALPMAALVWTALTAPRTDYMIHFISEGRLWRAGTTSLLLTLMTGFGAVMIGAGAAWLIGATEFRGRRWLGLLLMAPLAVPPYLTAAAAAEAFDYAGPVQTALRGLMGWKSRGDYWFPQIRSLGGAAVLLSLALYPYVYLLARPAFEERSASAEEAARILGAGFWARLWRIDLPLARPAIAAGAAAAMMEAAADFGAVDILGVQTLTRSVYGIWSQAHDWGAAAMVALPALIMAFGLIGLERAARRREARLSFGRRRKAPRRALGAAGTLIAWGLCLVPITAGFLAPVGFFSAKAFAHPEGFFDPGLLAAAGATLRLALIGAAIVAAAGFFLALAHRLAPSRPLAFLTRLASLGYAAPGSILALGVIIPLTGLDSFLGAAVFWGGSGALLYAYLARFLAISHGGAEAALGRVTPHMEAAARALGAGRWRMARAVHLPLTGAAMAAVFLTAFIDIAKELSATLLLRPAGLETLATWAYDRASSTENFSAAAPSALLMILLALAPAGLAALLARQSA